MLEIMEQFDTRLFLSDYWQRKPCLIQNWKVPTPCPLDTLLALTVEHDLPSRLVEGSLAGEDWQVSHGLTSMQELPSRAKDWTLLVQEVDKVYEPAVKLMQDFRFLPDWCLDDIMVSQAVKGGSVGPHRDAYDVFLVQVLGQRCWELAGADTHDSDDRFELALLADWRPEQQVITSPGDVLYLPAGIAHHGVAQGPCQTWSVGIRTPSGPELLMALTEQLAEAGLPADRLGLSGIDRAQPARITHAQLGSIRTLMHACLAMDDAQLARFSAGVLTRWRLWPADSDIEAPDLSDLLARLAAGDKIKLAPTARLALLDDAEQPGVMVNGMWIDCPESLACALAQSRQLDASWSDQTEALLSLLESEALGFWNPE